MHILSIQFLCRIQDESNFDGSWNVTLSERDWSTVSQKLASDPTRRQMLAMAIASLNVAGKKNGK